MPLPPLGPYLLSDDVPVSHLDLHNKLMVVSEAALSYGPSFLGSNKLFPAEFADSVDSHKDQAIFLMVEDEELLPTTGACWRTCFPSVRPSVGLRRRLYRITVSSAVTICRYGTSYIEGNADQIKVSVLISLLLQDILPGTCSSYPPSYFLDKPLHSNMRRLQTKLVQRCTLE